ncbi:MAG: hypothetical protein A2020_01480 [Lentisphaerae bacterium GWF2_45_14]|nr:MAG: hypothetical protein A2020_01480 [Lentisphaerae bacterium GWF2_45_14]
MTEKYIDLHTHSNASDGSFTPSEIFKLAGESGLSAVALTDHDTVSGISEFLKSAEENDSCTAIPGVEISVDLGGSEVHIVGLFIDHNCPSLLKLLTEIRVNRDSRNSVIIDKLQAMGYDISLHEVNSTAGGESVGRPHFAKILIEKGYFLRPQEVFDKCLKRGASAYCTRKLPSPEEAIREIHKAGGLAFWAHAVYRLKNERTFVRRIIKKLIACEIDGVEAYYSTYSPAQQNMMIGFAEEFNLLKSGGSDFHGSNQPAVSLGTGINGTLKVPADILLEMNDTIDRKKRTEPAL